MDKLKISELIIQELNKSHDLGEQTGGSGHKAYIGATLQKVKQETEKDGSVKVIYQYSIFRESEFTVYGENDPKPDIYENEMIIRDNKVVSNKQIRVVQSSFEPFSMLDYNEEPSEDDKYWFDRLDLSYDKGYTEKENKLAIKYFHLKEEFPEYLLTPSKSFGLKRFPKSMWEPHLKVLVKWVDKQEVKECFCQYIDDPNWPGYKFAYETLLNLGTSALPIIDREIILHKDDLDRVDQLNELKESIEAKTK